MKTKSRNKYIKDVDTHVKNLYDKTIEKNFLYNSIEQYMNSYKKDDIVVKYKNHLISVGAGAFGHRRRSYVDSR